MDEVQDLPGENDIYLQRENCTQAQVNMFIKLGYTPWQITPVVRNLKKNGAYVSEETVLIYHFIRRKEKKEE